MDKSVHDCYGKARAFLWRNARPVDLARWQTHFEGGGKDAVLTALSFYQNEDGGFGHALETDAWNPHSSPIQTWAAAEILREINFTHSAHPIIQGILRYLYSGKDFNGHFWSNTVETNNDYPHAPWWQTGSQSTSHHNYNPTACMAGFILRFSPSGSALPELGRHIAKEAYGSFMAGDLLGDMHTAKCFVRLMEYAQDAGNPAQMDLDAFRGKLIKQVSHILTRDTSLWQGGYVCKPSQFISGRDSIFFQENRELAEYECDFILGSQQEDGSWAVPWGWGAYEEEWSISKNWWKSDIIIRNMLYLKGLGKY